MIDLKELKRRLREALSEETEESLTEFINQLRERENTSAKEDISILPPEDKLQKEVECGASWQLITSSGLGQLKCRHCGVYVTSGGTPKCLKK